MVNKIIFVFLTNFKPFFFFKTSNTSNFKKKKIYFKYILFFSFFFNLSKKNKSTISFFFKKKKITKFTFLNAPYRHKLSKSTIGFEKYDLIFVNTLNINFFKIINMQQLFFFMSFFLLNYFNFESNIIFFKKKKIFLKFKLLKFFTIKK